MRYSIVIPCYNEEENLPRLIETVQELAEGKDIEFILVENGSKDNSYEVMQSLTDGISYIKIVKVEINQGLGYGIHQGILHAQGDYIGWIHADMQTPVLDIEQLFHYLKNREGKNIMVKARRHNRSSIDDFFTNCMALYCSMVFRLFVTRAVLNPCHQTSPLPNSTLGLWNQETIYLFPSPMFFSRTSATATTMLRKTLQFILDV